MFWTVINPLPLIPSRTSWMTWCSAGIAAFSTGAGGTACCAGATAGIWGSFWPGTTPGWNPWNPWRNK